MHSSFQIVVFQYDEEMVIVTLEGIQISTSKSVEISCELNDW